MSTSRSLNVTPEMVDAASKVLNPRCGIPIWSDDIRDALVAALSTPRAATAGERDILTQCPHCRAWFSEEHTCLRAPVRESAEPVWCDCRRGTCEGKSLNVCVMKYAESLDKARAVASKLRKAHYAEIIPTGHPLTATRLVDYADAIDTVCAAASHAVPEGREDSARLDWLESEMDREQHAIVTKTKLPHSLFRRNVPITRAAIDAERFGEHSL